METVACLARISLPRCRRCGKCCCYLFNADKNTWVECTHLHTDSRGYCTCGHYHKRIGTYVGGDMYCGYRKDSPYDIPGCPYNVGKPMHPQYI